MPVWNNEFEYLDSTTSPTRTINTAQSIMNWFAFAASPTWYWLHALKPTTNEESPGYGLGFWRPYSDTNFSHFPDVAAGHWTYNPDNWNGECAESMMIFSQLNGKSKYSCLPSITLTITGVAGFARYIPWDSVRVNVIEDELRGDNRILAYMFNPTVRNA